MKNAPNKTKVNGATALVRTDAPATGRTITPERVRRSLQARYNPIANLTPANLTSYLDQFAQGYLGLFARLADAIERRDDKVAACKRKRCSAIARYGFEILTSDTGDDDALAQTAEEHKRVLEYFYGNLTAVNALDENQRGGFSLLVRQMADAIGKKYSVHEIIMQPGSGAEDGGLTAELRFAPLWFFENRTGRLRYLDEDGSTEGVEMPPEQWLVAVNDGIMEACAVAYMFKRLPLQDWLSFTEKFGMPGILGKTPAAHGTTEWTAMEDAVGAFMNDWAAVVNAGAEIALVEAKSGGGQLPFEPLIERMDRAIAILWRGADLSTMSAGAGQGQGASVQGDESDLLEQDDAAWISETLQMQLSRLVIRYHFGDVRPLAYIQIKTRDDGDTKMDIEVLKAAKELGIPVAVKDARERLGLVTPDEGEELLGAKDEGGGMKDEEDAKAAALANSQLSTLNSQLSAESADLSRRRFLAEAKAQLGAAYMEALQPVRIELANALDGDEANLRERLEIFRNRLPELLTRVTAEPAARQRLEAIFAASFFNGMNPDRTNTTA
jgi:phage gp29-like protein